MFSLYFWPLTTLLDQFLSILARYTLLLIPGYFIIYRVLIIFFKTPLSNCHYSVIMIWPSCKVLLIAETQTLSTTCAGVLLSCSSRTMRHWSCHRWHCDKLLLEAIMRIYIIPWHLASHSKHYRCAASCLYGLWERPCAYVCVHVDYLSLTFSLAVHMVLCGKQQRGNANLELCNFFFLMHVCVYLYLCVCLRATVSELEYTVIKGKACHSCVSRGWGD